MMRVLALVLLLTACESGAPTGGGSLYFPDAGDAVATVDAALDVGADVSTLRPCAAECCKSCPVTGGCWPDTKGVCGPRSDKDCKAAAVCANAGECYAICYDQPQMLFGWFCVANGG